MLYIESPPSLMQYSLWSDPGTVKESVPWVVSSQQRASRAEEPGIGAQRSARKAIRAPIV